MGYPTSWRNGAGSFQQGPGSFQTPEPWRPSGGPANDNFSLPLNDNSPRLPPFKAGAFAKGLLSFFGPEAVIQTGLWDIARGLPGFSYPVPPSAQTSKFITTLPLYINWANDKVAAVELEGLKDTRQTGQSKPGATLPPNKITAAGQYVSTWNHYFFSIFLRGDELATYGPSASAADTAAVSFQPLQLPEVFPVPIPWPLIPLRPISPLVYVGGYEAPSTDPLPVANPRPAPRSVSPPKTPRGPAGPKVKERKVKASSGIMKIVHFINEGTEYVEIMQAFYGALPVSAKVHWPSGKIKKSPTVNEQVLALYRNWDKVDLDTALFDAVYGQITDRVWARVGVPGGIAGMGYGQNIGVNRIINQTAGQGVGDILGKVHDQIANLANHILGTTIKT
jgi:hypothetical protein